jgi:hypothetical protein
MQSFDFKIDFCEFRSLSERPFELFSDVCLVKVLFSSLFPICRVVDKEHTVELGTANSIKERFSFFSARLLQILLLEIVDKDVAFKIACGLLYESKDLLCQVTSNRARFQLLSFFWIHNFIGQDGRRNLHRAVSREFVLK